MSMFDYKQIDGNQYWKEKDGKIWRPSDTRDLFQCTCGSKTFHVFYSGTYETSVNCVKCNHIEVVHSG